MRFVAVCNNGHINDIDWYIWAHRKLPKANLVTVIEVLQNYIFIETGKGGGDFEHMHIVCECCKDQIGASEHNNLSGIEQGPIQKCDGWSPRYRSGDQKNVKLKMVKIYSWKWCREELKNYIIINFICFGYISI